MSFARYEINRPTNWLLAALYGAVIAIVIAFGASYLLTHIGLGVVSFAEGQSIQGPEVLKLSALNLYAVQHVTLVGSGKVVDPLGAGFVSAHITLPLTVWIIIPAIGLMIGGYAAARLRAGSRRNMVVPAVAGSILYAAILAAASTLARVKVGSFLLPEIEGFGANPPPIIFRPDLASTICYATGFGILFLYLGALVAVREQGRERTPGRWWACAKSAVIVALVIQLLVTVAAVVLIARREDSQPVTMSTIEILPTVSGIAYGLLYGGEINASVLSQLQEKAEPQIVLDYRANLYRGVSSTTDGEDKRRPMSLSVIVTGFTIAVLVAFLSGWFAVRWGSTDGSIPTAFRLIIVHSLYLLSLMFLCRLVLMISNKSEAFTASSVTSAGLTFSWVMIPGLLIYFFISLFGAYVAHRRFSASPLGFPHTW